MEELLGRFIKEIMDEYPKVSKILEDSGIGCATCNVGTCLLKDIIEIHNLSEDDEQAVMAQIAKAVYPDKEIQIPSVKRQVTPKDVSYSPPMKVLVDEHVFIKRLIAQLPRLIEEIEHNPENGMVLAKEGLDFIRRYADKFHHAKEEDILFKYFDEDLDILKTMHQEHEIGREHVRKAVEGLKNQDGEGITVQFRGYIALLTEHIKKEDEILYPWLDRSLSMKQVGELFSRFNEVEKEFGNEPKKYEEFVVGVEKTFNFEEKVS